MYRTLNPATEELIQTYPTLTWTAAEKKTRGAEEAYRSWRDLPLRERLNLVKKLAGLLRERKGRYGALITQEMGKPIAQAEIEIDKCARGCEYYAAHAGEFLTPQAVKTEAGKSHVRFDPLGVILGIMPWNFPFWQVFRFAVPTLLAGNAVLLKHAPNVPGCALAIEALYQEAGFPEGVFQSLFITDEDAGRLIESPYVQGVSLTGSDRAGSAVASVAGKSLKKTVLELGGSDPFIVLSDADLAKTIPVAVKSRMLNTGQSCIAAKRFIVVKNIFEKFEKEFLGAVSLLKTGDPTGPVDLGPLAREDLLVNLQRQVESSVKEGARMLVGGERPQGRGFFYLPTVLKGVRPGMTAFDQEVFGPVASLIISKDEEEAIELANKTSYGLGASLWTEDMKKAEVLIPRIEAGSVFVNGMVKSDPRLPFGGIKRSGYGRELASFGLHEFVNIKTVWIM